MNHVSIYKNNENNRIYSAQVSAGEPAPPLTPCSVLAQSQYFSSSARQFLQLHLWHRSDSLGYKEINLT